MKIEFGWFSHSEIFSQIQGRGHGFRNMFLCFTENVSASKSTRGVHTREAILKNKTRYLRLAVAFWIWDLVSVWEEKLDRWKLSLGDFFIQRFCLRFREEATDLDVCFRVARKRSLLQRGLYMYFELIKRRVNWFAGALIFLDLVLVFSKKLRFACFLYDAVKYGLCFGCTCFETIRIVIRYLQ